MRADVMLRSLQPNELEEAVALLARGMRDNPVHLVVFGEEPERRSKCLLHIFQYALPVVAAKGDVIGAFEAGSLVGVLGMVPPGRCQSTRGDMLRLVPHLLAGPARKNAKRLGQWLGVWGKHDPAEPHWHLGPVGVDAPHQGRGIGSALMTEFCARIDDSPSTFPNGVCGYLETDKSQNIRFYEKFGFETVAEAPVLGSMNWFMRRPPQPRP